LPKEQKVDGEYARGIETTTNPHIYWTEISMDLIMKLPKLGNKLVIMVVVYYLLKYANFCALAYPFTPSLVSQFFMDKIFKLWHAHFH
jgi:hypothetical protein